MVLLYGIPGDGPFELVADALEEMGTAYLILNPRNFKEIDFVLYLTGNRLDGEITVGPYSYPLTDFTGIYNRAVDFSMVPEAKTLPQPSTAYQQYQQLFSLLNIWIEASDCRVVNKGAAMSSNASKPFQLSLVQPFFEVPDTLITNSVPAVEEFCLQHGEIIYKSASSVRSIVKTITETGMHSLKTIGHCPTLFQQRLNGTNCRVHVINDTVFAIRVTSETVDYRYSHREGNETTLVPIELPADIRSKCIQLAGVLELPFAGIDLFETNDGRWFCFEVNPSPGFSYFENQTGQPIAKAVAQYLAGN